MESYKEAIDIFVNKKDVYKEAIDIFVNKKDVHEKIFVEILKKNPEIIVEAFRSFTCEEWESEALISLKNGKKIGAIKICRDATGLGLADAKNIVEKLSKENGYG